MNRVMMLLAVLGTIGLLLGGCKKQESAAPAGPAAAEPAKAEPAKPPAPQPPPAAAKAAPPATPPGMPAMPTGPYTGKDDVESHCGAFYDFTKKMIAAMSKAFAKKMGPGKTEKKMPPREKFMTACKLMPIEVARCMNPQVAMQKKEECQKVMMNADKTQMAKLREIMK